MHRTRVTPRRIWVWLLAVGLALVLVALGYRTWKVWTTVRSLLAQVDSVQAIAADPTSVDPAALGPMLQETHDGLVVLHDEARPALTLFPHLGWVPGVGPDLKALPPLIDIAVDLTDAGTVAMEALAPLLSLMDAGEAPTGEDPLVLIAQTLEGAQPELETVRVLVNRAAQRRTELDASQLSSRLLRPVGMLDRALPLAQAGVEATLLAPDLLGLHGSRTYLLMAQNSDELRPTGGFITGAGLVTVDGGRIVSISFRDSYFIDDLSKPYGEPPTPLYDYMLSELWLFRDANWSPDFPISAQKAAELYTYGQGVELDGVIAFDQQAAARLMEPLGPITLEGWDEPITSDSLIRAMRQAWNPSADGVSREWARTRKDFMGQLAQAALERIMRHPETVDQLELMRAMWEVLEERHLLIYLEEATAASWLRAQGWDGALRLSEGDYLMVVDANLGFNKVNPNIGRSLEYQVTLHTDGSARAELVINYQHIGPGDEGPCDQRATYDQGEQVTYEGLTAGCYWNYLRVYAPKGSLLRTASRHLIPSTYLLRGIATVGNAEVLPDGPGKAVFAQFLVVESGRALTTHFRYDLPQVADRDKGRWQYTLLIQKQAGTDSTPVSLTVDLPPGAQLLTATPPPRSVEGGNLTFALELDADAIVEVSYE